MPDHNADFFDLASSLVFSTPAEATSLHTFDTRNIPSSSTTTPNRARASGTDSDLSDVPDQQASSSGHALFPSPRINDDDEQGVDVSDLSDGRDLSIGSDDGDFEVESPMPTDHNTRNTRSSSQESRRVPKRKAGIEEDEDIRNNPELYGIRRSVSDRSL